MYDWEEEFEELDTESNDKDVGGKNVLLFLVDSSKDMQVKDPTSDLSLFQKCVQAATATLKSKIFKNDRDMVGVLGFGTKNKIPKSLNLEHMAELVPMDNPSREAILGLERFLGDNGPALVESELGCVGAGDISLNEVLWHSQSILSKVKGKVAQKRIIVMTCQDDPHAGDAQKNLKARRRATDLHNDDIYLDVVPVFLSGQTFNMDLFYRDLMRLAEDDWSGHQETDLDSLTDVILKKSYTKRSTGRLKLNLGGNLEVGVAIYNLLGRAAKPSKRKLAADTNEEIKSHRAWIHPRNGAPLLPSDLAKFMDYGGKCIKMLPHEVEQIRSFGAEENNLKLIGFRPLTSLKLGNYVRSSQFIYPTENTIKGSKKLFASLLLRCDERRLAAICKLKARSLSVPCFVALVPQKEVKEDDGVQITPSGFHVVYLPYLDDFRQLPATRINADPAAGGVDAAKEVISKLRLKKFIPVENAAIQSCYRMIEAHALHKPEVEPTLDETLPDLERMGRKLADRSETFLQKVYEESYDPAGPPRKVPKKESNAATKKGAGAASDESLDMEKTAKDGKVEKLTVEVLKTWLKGQGVSVTGMKKADLVAEVYSKF